MKLILENWRKFLTEAAKNIKDLPEDASVTLEKGADIFFIEVGDVGYIQARLVKNCGRGKVYGVVDVGADPGWGPLLYDIAMEYASFIGDGLTPDKEMTISPDAVPLWQYYASEKRSDVEKAALPPDCPKTRLISGEEPPGYLHLVYKKPTRNIIRALRQLGKWKIIRT